MLDGVRNQVAPSKSSAVARSGPRVSAPQIGWPPTNRGRRPPRRTTGTFVEPTSVTVLASAPSASVSRTCAGSEATGAATSTSSAPATASARSLAGLDRAALGGDPQRVRVGIPAA